MLATTIPTPRAAAAVAGAAGVLLLAACTGSSSGVAHATPTPVTVTKDTCFELVYLGRHLGVTAPTGFTADQAPAGREDLAQFYGVNLLAALYLSRADSEPPTVVIDVFAAGVGDRYTGPDALDQSVSMFLRRVRGSGSARAAVATPTTIDGGPGGVGGGTDPRALDYTDPDSVPTPLHWWTVQVGDTASGVQFVVAMAAKTKALDAQYQPVILGGLHVGGCPTPKAR